MDIRIHNRRLVSGLGLVLLIGVVVMSSIVALLMIRDYGASNYPGAVQTADQSSYRLAPQPRLQRDTTYRTSAPFPDVYNWYSQRFNLGPEARAMSNCIQMQGTTRWWFINRYTSVTLCDTPSGRMVFVQRSVWLR